MDDMMARGRFYNSIAKVNCAQSSARLGILTWHRSYVVTDLARATCIRAQRPSEQVNENMKDIISKLKNIMAQLGASRRVFFFSFFSGQRATNNV